MPNLMLRAATWLGLAAEPASTANTGQAIATKIRQRRQVDVSAERALTLTVIYRGIQIHATSTCQAPLYATRDGIRESVTPPLLVRPNIDQTRQAFLEETVVSLYTDGNAFWRISRNSSGQAINLEVLNPFEVTINVQRDRQGIDHLSYAYRGKSYTTRDIQHLKLLRIPGLHRGLGPIQAAQIDVRGALDARDYGAMWLNDANMPDGVLTTDQVLGPGDADKYKHIWYGRNVDGTVKDTDSTSALTERLRVLGQGLSYTPLLLKPSDVQFLETQQFNNVQLARLIGAPASLMLIGVEGGSQVYANIEQDFIGYVRFSLRKALTEMETAFTEVMDTAGVDANFDTDVLSRPDTKTRMEGHAIGIEAGVLTDDEARAEEGRPPLTDAQRAQINARTPAPTLKVKQ